MRTEQVFTDSWDLMESNLKMYPGKNTDNEHQFIRALRECGYDKVLRISYSLNSTILSREVSNDITDNFPYASFIVCKDGILLQFHFDTEIISTKTNTNLTQEITKLLDRLVKTDLIYSNQSLSQEERIMQIASSGDTFLNNVQDLNNKITLNNTKSTLTRKLNSTNNE